MDVYQSNEFFVNVCKDFRQLFNSMEKIDIYEK